MNTKNKTLRAALLATALALTTASAAHADPNPANDSGSFTVRITPNVDLGVTVDTSGAAWVGSANLDVSQDLGTDKLLDDAKPIVISMAGNFNSQELTLRGIALNTWTLDTDEVDGVDQLRLYAMFGVDPQTVGSPDIADFNGAGNLITATERRAGQPAANEAGNTNHTYELSDLHGEYEDVDNMSATATRLLWLRSSTPSTSSTDLQSAFTVVVTAVTGTGL